MWAIVKETLNEYGGVISLISLIFSIIVFYRTGRIIKSIEKSRNYKFYQESRKKTAERLTGLALSISKDHIFDMSLKGEIELEIGLIEHYHVFMGVRTKYKLWNLNRHVKDWKNKNRIVASLNKMAGDLSADEYRFFE